MMLKKFVLGGIAALVLAACGGEGGSASSSAPAQSAGASGDSLIERINNKGTVTVGTEGTYAPFTYHDKDGKLTGYDVEVTRAVAEKLGVKVEFKETQWDSMMAGLKAGRFDVVANQVGLTSPERQATFDKSDPYSWSSVLVARNDSNIKSIDDIKGVKTAQSLTSNYGEKAKAAGADLVAVDGLAQSLTLIEQKRADATLNDELAVLDYLKKNPNAGVKIVWSAPADEKAYSGLIVNKGNDEAVAKFSTAINELKADGTLKKLGEQFFGKDISVQ